MWLDPCHKSIDFSVIKQFLCLAVSTAAVIFASLWGGDSSVHFLLHALARIMHFYVCVCRRESLYLGVLCLVSVACVCIQLCMFYMNVYEYALYIMWRHCLSWKVISPHPNKMSICETVLYNWLNKYMCNSLHISICYYYLIFFITSLKATLRVYF